AQPASGRQHKIRAIRLEQICGTDIRLKSPRNELDEVHQGLRRLAACLRQVADFFQSQHVINVTLRSHPSRFAALRQSFFTSRDRPFMIWPFNSSIAFASCSSLRRATYPSDGDTPATVSSTIRTASTEKPRVSTQ